MGGQWLSLLWCARCPSWLNVDRPRRSKVLIAPEACLPNIAQSLWIACVEPWYNAFESRLQPEIVQNADEDLGASLGILNGFLTLLLPSSFIPVNSVLPQPTIHIQQTSSLSKHQQLSYHHADQQNTTQNGINNPSSQASFVNRRSQAVPHRLLRTLPPSTIHLEQGVQVRIQHPLRARSPRRLSSQLPSPGPR